MGRDPIEKQCGEHTYRVMPLPPKRALRMLGKIGRLIGPALGSMVDGAMSSGGGDIDKLLDMDTSELSNLSFGRVAAELFDRWEDGPVEEILDELSSVSFVSLGEHDREKWPVLKSVFDMHFLGSLGDLVKWLRFALEVQYADFFSGSGDLVGFLAQHGAQNRASPSPRASAASGSSGGL